MLSLCVPIDCQGDTPYLIPAKKVDINYYYGAAVVPDGVLGTWTYRPTYY